MQIKTESPSMQNRTTNNQQRPETKETCEHECETLYKGSQHIPRERACNSATGYGHIENTNRSTHNNTTGAQKDTTKLKVCDIHKTNCHRVFTPPALFSQKHKINAPSPTYVQKAIRSDFYSFRPNGQIVTFKSGWYGYLPW